MENLEVRLPAPSSRAAVDSFLNSFADELASTRGGLIALMKSGKSEKSDMRQHKAIAGGLLINGRTKVVEMLNG